MPFSTISDQITIAAPATAIWAALIDREQSRIWAGADFTTDWQPGSPLAIKPLIIGKKGADKGEVLEVLAPALLSYRVLPRVSGLPDLPDNYSHVTISLAELNGQTRVEISHAVPASPSVRVRDSRSARSPATTTSRFTGAAPCRCCATSSKTAIRFRCASHGKPPAELLRLLPWHAA